MRLTVGELAHGGAAVARVDGRVVFVEGAIPGETVEAEVTHRRKDFWRAQAISVVEPAQARVEPPCPFFKLGCGGCQLQHVGYEEQLAQKRGVLHHQLEQAKLDFPFDRIDALGMDDPWRYRLRGEFHVLHRDGTVALGFYRKHTYRTLPIDACLIHAEAIEHALPAFAHAAQDPAAENEKSVIDFKAGKEQALRFLIGQGMKISKGRANPQRLDALLREKISK